MAPIGNRWTFSSDIPFCNHHKRDSKKMSESFAVVSKELGIPSALDALSEAVGPTHHKSIESMSMLSVF